MGKFISFGNINLNVTDIREFGISNGKIIYYEYLYKKKEIFIWELFSQEPYERTGGTVMIDKKRYDSVKSGNAYSLFEPGEEKEVTEKDLWNMINYIPYYQSARRANQNDVFVKRSKKYLYVTTYQKKNYKFYEDNGKFNIYDKLDELKRL